MGFRRASTAATVLLLAAAALAISGCTDSAYWLRSATSAPEPTTRPTDPATPSTDSNPATPTTSPPPTADPLAAVTCPAPTAPTTRVTTSDELTRALRDATPGSSITLADARFTGTFTIEASGTTDAPITLCGGPGAVLDGGSTDSGYTLHLDGAAHWLLQGFTVSGGQKGVMLDATTQTVLRSLTVTGTGDEAVHLRRASTDNLVQNTIISNTGLHTARFGEGIYVGTAESNWCDISDCEPDASDRNRIVGNTISGTTSEAIDVKEGTTGGELRGNALDGSATVEADSLIDVKGSGWAVTGNTGSSSPADGAQVHVIVDGWGADNSFEANRFEVARGGFAVNLAGAARRAHNIVSCGNEALLAGISTPAAVSNVDCAP